VVVDKNPLKIRAFRAWELSVGVPTVIGMEILGERPAWSMTNTDKVSRLDAVFAEVNRLTTYGLHLIGDLDTSGHAADVGAGDTARFLSTRYCIDPAEARRDLRLARALAKYETVAAALPNPATPFPPEAHPDADQPNDPDNPTDPTDNPDDAADATDADDQAEDLAADQADGSTQPGRGRPLHPAQAFAIVSALEKVPDTVPVENLDAAERQLVNLARTFTPSQLRDAANRMRTILDPDGPEPDENRAYHRESLTLKPADNGVKFGGYLANENAELFRTLIHNGAKPHKTIDDEPDPRPRDKRQADALTTLLTTAAAVTPTNDPSTPTNPNTTTTIPANRRTASNPTDDHKPASHRTAPSTGPTDPGTGRSTTPTTAAHPNTSTGASSRPAATPGTGDIIGIAGDSDPNAGENLPPDDSPADHDASGHNASRDAASDRYIPGHGPKAHLTITIDYHALKTATANATGDPVFGDALSAAAVRRLACDAQVVPLVLGSKSQPLDVGTTKRLVTAPIRLALNARDRGCVVCGAPPIQCEAHHLIHWIDGGITAVSNLVLLCKRHHLDLHTGHWHIQIIDGVVQVTRPTWANPDPIPPNKYKPPTHHTPHDGSSTAADHPWPHATTGDLDIGPDAARRAIWGDISTGTPADIKAKPTEPTDATPTALGSCPDSSPPFDPWSNEADGIPPTDRNAWSPT